MNFLILGGPGTGKSSILLNLLKRFAEEELDVRVEMSDRMTEYVDACLPEVGIARFRLGTDAGCNILLIDDPYGLDVVENRIASGSAPVVIAACDPFQLPNLATDAEILGYRTRVGAVVLPLDECNRQKEAVGRQTKMLIDRIVESSPFLADHKVANHQQQHRGLTYLANSMRFPNPAGYVQNYADATIGDIRKELKRLKSKPLWSHWPALLVVQDRTLTISQEVLNALDAINHELVVLEHDGAIRGLEYQHVFLFLNAALYSEMMNGFHGSGQAKYSRRRRLMRIPFSRAKDSLVLFVASS